MGNRHIEWTQTTSGGRRTRDSKRDKSGAHLCVHVGRKNGLDVFEDIPPVKRTRDSKRNLVKMEIEAAKRNGLDIKRNRKAVAI